MNNAESYTVCIIKPSLVNKSLGNTATFDELFQIVTSKFLMLTPEHVKRFYPEHVGKPYYQAHEEYMTKDAVRVLLLKLRGPGNGVEVLRTLLGATDPTKAGEGTLRQRYGTTLPDNGFHGSDSLKSVLREACFFWGACELISVGASVLLDSQV